RSCPWWHLRQLLLTASRQECCQATPSTCSSIMQSTFGTRHPAHCSIVPASIMPCTTIETEMAILESPHRSGIAYLAPALAAPGPLRRRKQDNPDIASASPG